MLFSRATKRIDYYSLRRPARRSHVSRCFVRITIEKGRRTSANVQTRPVGPVVKISLLKINVFSLVNNDSRHRTTSSVVYTTGDLIIPSKDNAYNVRFYVTQYTASE